MDNPLTENAIATLWDIAGGEPVIFQDLIDEYVTMAKEVVAGIEQALTANDARAAEHAAHSLKGSSAMMGAHLVKLACAAVEQAAASGNLAAARALLPALRSAHQATVERLLSVRDAPAPTA